MCRLRKTATFSAAVAQVVHPGTHEAPSFVDVRVGDRFFHRMLYAVSRDEHVYAFDEHGAPMAPDVR